jgi:tripeptide aminopeptidase
VAGDRLVATFCELVRIDSVSGEEAAVARRCADALQALGFTVVFDDAGPGAGSEIGNLFATLPGTVPGALRLILSAHMDTVEPGRGIEPVVGEDGVIRPAGDTVLGADDKAGIAAILEACTRVVESGAPRGDIQVLLTVCEETGLRGAKAMDRSLLDGDLAIVLDAAGEPGGIVSAAPTHSTFRAEFHGVAAHAGVEPEAGRSALVAAARAVAAMRLGRIDERSTANVGVIEGGSATNVVAPEALVTGECRSRDAATHDALQAEMDAALKAAAAETGVTVDVAWTCEYRGYTVDPDGAPYLLVAAAAADAGLTPRPHPTGGGADSNILAAEGIPVIALSSAMRGPHSREEHLVVSELHELTDLVIAIIGRAAEVAS